MERSSPDSQGPEKGCKRQDTTSNALAVGRKCSIATTDVSFDEDKLFDGCKRTPPPLFTEDSIEVINDNDMQFDQFTETDSLSPIPSTGHSKGNKVRISDSAMTTCHTILDGFAKSTTANIFMHGQICFDLYANTENSNILMKDIAKHRDLLEAEPTADACQLNQVRDLLDAIKEKNYARITQLYYRSQHTHSFHYLDEPKTIPVYIDHLNLNEKWNKHIDDAMQSINDVTPGINLVKTTAKDKSIIEIGDYTLLSNAKYKKIACTKGSIKNGGKSVIHLGTDWNEGQMKGTSLHELMHALGFYHEMQRNDSDLYIEFAKNLDNSYENCFDAITRFDPYSVMMYSECQFMVRKNGDKIWQQKLSTKRTNELSELNKVALNLKFKPCKREKYDPILDSTMDMVYCGRKVMMTHSQVGKNTTNGFCGKKNWANCAACRVLLSIEKENGKTEIRKLRRCLAAGKWQGLSGLFYCGKDLSSWLTSRECGPDNGDPCSDCEKQLYNHEKKSYYDYLKCKIS